MNKKFYLFILAMMIAVNAFGYEKQTWNYETGAKQTTGSSGVHDLDIYYPETGEGSYPVFIWLSANIGNGGVPKESAYSTASVLIDTVLHRGYAVVVPNCSQQGKDGQPLPLNDIKAVIRFLHNNGEGMSEYPRDIDTSFIAIGGFDVDGLSATMMGGKNWIKGGAELEGTVGNFLDKSSSVDAVASWAGTYLSLGELANYERVFDRWLGGSTSESWSTDNFTMVSIKTRMSDPAPTVLFHGSHDGVISPAYAVSLYNWLQEKIGDDSEYYLINGQSHSLIIDSSKYYYYGYMVNFLDRIRAKKAQAQAIDQITNDHLQITNKAIRDGQLLILRGSKTYTMTGQELK